MSSHGNIDNLPHERFTVRNEDSGCTRGSHDELSIVDVFAMLANMFRLVGAHQTLNEL